MFYSVFNLNAIILGNVNCEILAAKNTTEMSS